MARPAPFSAEGSNSEVGLAGRGHQKPTQPQKGVSVALIFVRPQMSPCFLEAAEIVAGGVGFRAFPSLARPNSMFGACLASDCGRLSFRPPPPQSPLGELGGRRGSIGERLGGNPGLRGRSVGDRPPET